MVGTAVVVICGVSLDVGGQESDENVSSMRVVSAIGCVERNGESWFLTRLPDPVETD